MANITNVSQHFTLSLYTFRQSKAIIKVHRGQGVAKWMAATRLREAPHQRIGLSIKKEQVNIYALPLKLLYVTWKLLYAITTTHIHANSNALITSLAQGLHEVYQQSGRQVVHAIVSAIFKRPERHALARAGEATN